jgi:hypothetical protein
MPRGVYVRGSTPNQMQKQPSEHQLDRLRLFLTEQHEDLADDHIFRDDGSRRRLQTTAPAARICVGPAWIACGMRSAGMSGIVC